MPHLLVSVHFNVWHRCILLAPDPDVNMVPISPSHAALSLLAMVLQRCCRGAVHFIACRTSRTPQRTEATASACSLSLHPSATACILHYSLVIHIALTQRRAKPLAAAACSPDKLPMMHPGMQINMIHSCNSPLAVVACKTAHRLIAASCSSDDARCGI